MRESLAATKAFLRKIQVPVRSDLFFTRKALVVLAISILLLVLIGFWRVEQRVQRQLDEESERLAKQNLVPFEKKLGATFARKELAVWQSHKNSRAVARFKDSYFVATDGGLVELGPAGNRLREYSVLDGLPESDLLSLASFGGKLYIGTRTQGLASFDGHRFESYRFSDRVPLAVNALFEDAGRLLLGTMAGGLIEFDGQQFKEIKVGPDHKRLSGIDYLSKDNSRLYVGTFAEGLWIAEGGRWSQFTLADGLLSNRIIGVVSNRGNLIVASDFGVSVAPVSGLSAESAEPPEKRFRPLITLPSLSGMLECQSIILLCKDDGESFALPPSEDLSHLPQLSPLPWKRPDDLTGCSLTALDQHVWLLGSEGIQVAQMDGEGPGKTGPLLFSPFGQIADKESLTTNLISAMAFDPQGRLWAGSFRNGIDVLTAEGRKLAHLESEVGREINSITEDRDAKTMLVATSQGVLRFNSELGNVERWSTADGLLSNSVLQLARTSGNGAPEQGAGDRAQVSLVACATSKGLALGERGKWRGLTTVQGLPSNSVYTVLLQGRRLYAGTLSGLAVIEAGRVVEVFKDTNSNLTHNWITALCLAGSSLFVGTYGGGVFELTPAGALNGFSSETGRAVVNPNAMWSDGARLYIGTLDGALIFDLRRQKWTSVKEELPSRTVLGITGDERYVYFGTTSGIARVARGYFISEKS